MECISDERLSNSILRRDKKYEKENICTIVYNAVFTRCNSHMHCTRYRTDHCKGIHDFCICGHRRKYHITPLFVGYRFLAGFGTFTFLRAKLDATGHVEISNLSDPSDTIVVDGSRVVNVFGFIGHLRWEDGKLTMYGAAIFVSW